MYIYFKHAWCSQKAEVIRCPGNRITECCELPCGCYELNPKSSAKAAHVHSFEHLSSPSHNCRAECDVSVWRLLSWLCFLPLPSRETVSINLQSAHFLEHWLLTSFTAACWSLDLRQLPKDHEINAWSQHGALEGHGEPFRRWNLQKEVSSLESCPWRGSKTQILLSPLYLNHPVDGAAVPHTTTKTWCLAIYSEAVVLPISHGTGISNTVSQD